MNYETNHSSFCHPEHIHFAQCKLREGSRGYKMKFFVASFLVIAIFLLILPINVKAIGVSVSPSRLEIKTSLSKEISKNLIVKNVSSNVALFEVYLDDFESFIKARPSSFVLESQEEKNIDIKVYSNETGKYTTNISVISRPLNKKELQIGSGVKIPLEIEVAEGDSSKLISNFILGKIGVFKISFYYAIIFLILLVLIVYIYFLKRKIKKLNKPR